ncbi:MULTISPECIES: adenosylcobinamide-GDP ribazoletransferase [Pseudoalteromonas]|uniref:Adenosylcobinamide-GDP ribazoletransferase n=1 Tax=Pseudoalteromonas haloplanktis TaxID=228 RepID=A0ABU1BEU2_PSEHA|nr:MULTISPECIES: adenosylcobinamide-GDP ribazoletransferase [Pseudoalteromonas]MCF6144766.1 adenosylcobinamide-GDP ribazoletransferase [Pseudoalteromonas mariniglutinosa NCIMB 1770]MDQ9093004.1 adenosylcobinamide-GDP ribazoletransferase [Pseudoalteromonas haloplanktis]TMN72229.1 adenosylcobinamide-GDP ribazoletransferase [Pseudoalteromonas sp. S1727]
MQNNSVYNNVTQWQLLLLAISFLTRIPVKLRFDVSTAHLNQASRYFAFVGLLLGGLLALSYGVFQLLFPPSISILLMMAIGLLLTGAFHEDGWADVWDGFGGGWQVEQKLAIMKDSRLGTYGAAALFIILLIKFQSLLFLSESLSSVLSAILLGQCLSRMVATSLIMSMDYVSEDATSKVKPLAMHLSVTSLTILLLTAAALLAGLILLGIISWQSALIISAVLLLLRLILISWFKRQLGGYTGDCLGAAQQLSEIAIYLTLVSLL